MKVLVVSAHPDDETLGCGGTLLKHHAAGDALSWLVVTGARSPQWAPEIAERKRLEVDRVAAAYGVERCAKLGLPAARLDTVPQADLIDRIRDVVASVRPGTVYLVHDGDVHTDHRAVYSAAMSVLKPFHMGGLGVRRVLCYETLSSTDAAPPHSDHQFLPSVFSDIGPFLERKLEIMAMYETERHPDPLPRGPEAIRALARYRGATIGCEYAEAFMLIRDLI